ncbi:MAG: ORF6N domain-containing protein [Spirochaetales bacterium]|nr:ORF6N domain-containing protein [Spirochaetales bacterium]
MINLKKIKSLRKQNIILDSDLALIYGVETKRINERAKRNIAKFPSDFMFQLTKLEFDDLKSQIATSSSAWGGRRS